MSKIPKCETCIHRDPDGYCRNDKYISEDESETRTPEQKAKSMIYSYYEGGAFWVGPKFGCVHHKATQNHAKR